MYLLSDYEYVVWLFVCCLVTYLLSGYVSNIRLCIYFMVMCLYLLSGYGSVVWLCACFLVMYLFSVYVSVVWLCICCLVMCLLSVIMCLQLSVYVSVVWLSVCVFVYVSVVWLCICCLVICLYVCLCVCLSGYVSVVWLSVCVSGNVCLFCIYNTFVYKRNVNLERISKLSIKCELIDWMNNQPVNSIHKSTRK